MFETQEVWAEEAALLGVITDGSSLAFLTPSLLGVFSIMRSSDHTNQGRGGEKIGAGPGPSPNTNCQNGRQIVLWEHYSNHVWAISFITS